MDPDQPIGAPPQAELQAELQAMPAGGQGKNKGVMCYAEVLKQLVQRFVFESAAEPTCVFSSPSPPTLPLTSPACRARLSCAVARGSAAHHRQQDDSRRHTADASCVETIQGAVQHNRPLSAPHHSSHHRSLSCQWHVDHHAEAAPPAPAPILNSRS